MTILNSIQELPEYVRRPKSDTWHWIESCRNFPRKRGRVVYDGTKTDNPNERPTYGELCNTCLARERNGIE